MFEHHLQNFKSNYSPTINFLKKNGYKKFAIVASNPRISIFDSFITKLFKNIAHFWLNNMSFTVSLEDKIKPDYYPFIIAIPDKYIEHASRSEQLDEIGLSGQRIANNIISVGNSISKNKTVTKIVSLSKDVD